MKLTVLAALFTCACAVAAPEELGTSIGTCNYESPFSGDPECREFFDTEAATAEESCAGVGTTFSAETTCAAESHLGTCTYVDDGVTIRTTVFGDDVERCGSNRFGCETFAGGVWAPAPFCDDDDGLVVLSDPFPLPELQCEDPLPGEPEGQSAGGQVCTWDIVSGATEEGRHFSDYADCAPVIRQRGYTPVPPNERAATADSRREDPTYLSEETWVRAQLDAGSCECCHSSSVATEGAAVFDSASTGSLANQFNDRGLAMGAGWIPTVGFGTYPPEQNNGFERSSPETPYLSIIPTTDQPRMMAFFEAELAERGLVPSDFAGDEYGAGPLDEQLNYVPERCSAEEGVDADGVIRWAPGRARYVYLLETGSLMPTVPPNLDTPSGTLWRVDLPASGEPVASGTVHYGEVPDGMSQAFPVEVAPTALVAGHDYILYASADILYPISRCVFTAGEAAPETGCASGGGSGGGVVATICALILTVRRRRLAPGPSSR